MKSLLSGALVAVLLFNASATITRADEIAPAAADAATASLSGVQCALRAENGQTKFRQGETISLVASFTSDRAGYKINRYVQNNRGLAKLGEINVTPPENVTDPLGEVPESGVLMISGFVPEPMPLGAKPVEFSFVLNDWARFNKPGIYQVTLTTTRVFAAKSDGQRGRADFIFGAASASPIVSLPLQIEITPPDEAWANQQIELWRAYWDKKASSPRTNEIKPPSNDISFLGTRAAMTAIIRHLSDNTKPRSSDDDTYLFRTGFLGFADRDWLIGAMKRAIEQPDYAVTQGFFDLLIELEVLRAEPRPVGADATRVKYDKGADGQWIAQAATPAQQLQIDWKNRRDQTRKAASLRTWLLVSAAVEPKTSAARALTLHSLLELAWLTNLEKEPPLKAQLPRLYESSSNRFDYASMVATLAYFVRVNPGYGVPKVAERSRINGKADAHSSLLFDVAALQPSAQLEPLAISNLNNAGEGAATDAAQTLARIGSPAAKSALLARLQNTSDAAYPRVRGHIEWRVVEALANAQNWLCPPAQLRQIRELCQTEQGRNTVDGFLRARADRSNSDRSLLINYSPGADNYWGVDSYSGRGMDKLRAKLAQFPRGTAFSWQSLGSGPDAVAAFETTRKWAAARGLNIAPYEKIFVRKAKI